MDLHQPVMKTHRDLIAWVGAKFNPSFGIVEQLTQSYRNLPKRNSVITFVFAIFARPSPNIALRAPVQIFHELFSEQIALAPQRQVAHAGYCFARPHSVRAGKRNVQG